MLPLSKIYLFIITIIICFVIIFYFSLLDVNIKDYTQYLLKTKISLLNDSISKLLNANAIVNLPIINIVTNNPEIDNLQKCKNGAIFLGDDASADYRKQCLTTCGSTGKVIEITEDDERYANGTKLTPGFWCIVNDVNCNTKTGYVVATINSVVCRTKYPNMFGGSEASTITACSDEAFPSTGSVLWDYANNERVNPLTVQMSNEDETLPDGSFRFRCKYLDDENGNYYLENPLNRFHPMTDPCNKTIYRAHRDVKTILNKDSWYCDCGDFDTTRVKHKIENDIKSTCTSCFYDTSIPNIQYPYNCFTVNSLYSSVSNTLPCKKTKFTVQGNLCDTGNLEVTNFTGDITPFSGITITSYNTDNIGSFD